MFYDLRVYITKHIFIPYFFHSFISLSNDEWFFWKILLFYGLQSRTYKNEKDYFTKEKFMCRLIIVVNILL